MDKLFIDSSWHLLSQSEQIRRAHLSSRKNYSARLALAAWHFWKFPEMPRCRKGKRAINLNSCVSMKLADVFGGKLLCGCDSTVQVAPGEKLETVLPPETFYLPADGRRDSTRT
jgi:hypothetical protein